eukprot:908846-Rhodomonas_salina.5
MPDRGHRSDVWRGGQELIRRKLASLERLMKCKQVSVAPARSSPCSSPCSPRHAPPRPPMRSAHMRRLCDLCCPGV